MARIRAVVTLPWTTALPEDVTVNTFHFLTPTSPASSGEMSNINTVLDQFYNFDRSGAGTAIAAYLSGLISRVAGACTIEQFDLDDDPPRQPVNTYAFTLDAAAAATVNPTEVALCSSFQAAPVSGVPQARRRGRVFLGPFVYNASTTDTATGRPGAALVTAVRLASEGLQNDAFLGTVPWCVYSRTGDAMAAVTNGWVDNEWDTMRSRGRRPTTRNAWS